MKVLQINTTCNSGSTGKIAYDLHCMLLQDGHESRICYGRGKDSDDKNLYKFNTNFGVNLDGFLTRITGLNGYFSNSATKKLLEYIKQFNPDVVHIHNIHGYYVNMFKLIDFLKKNKIKTVITMHDEFLYTGKCGCTYSCEKWETHCNGCILLKDYPKSLFFDCSSKMFDAKKKAFCGFSNLIIVTPSKWLLDRVKKSFLDDKNSVVINNGIDVKNVFRPSPFDDLKEKHGLKDEKIVLSVAQNFMNEHKGGKYILELAKLLKEENIKFILIGISDSSLELGENVIAISRTDNQNELAKYYSMADIFIICSKQENFPTVCLEALACGTPVIGFDRGGTKETAPDSLGKFAEYGDIEALNKLVLDCVKTDEISKQCYDFAYHHYSKEKMYNEYLYLYQNN